jgi:hypothetical protein
VAGWTFNIDGSATFSTNNFGTFTLPDYNYLYPMNPNIGNISSFNNSYHEYSNFTPISPVGMYSQSEIYELLLRNATPGSNGLPIYVGDTSSIFGLGTVVHDINSGDFGVVNITVVGQHSLDPGVVYRSVEIVDGQIGIRTIGIGTGRAGQLNSLLAEPVWGAVDNGIDGYLYDTFENPGGPQLQPPLCFVAGTLILCADGVSRPIETLCVGDYVLAFDPSSNLGRGDLGTVEIHDSHLR